MENDDDFIQQNESVLLSHPVIAAETQKMGGQWKLEDITVRFSRKRDIDFHFLLVNGIGEGLTEVPKLTSRVAKYPKSNWENGE